MKKRNAEETKKIILATAIKEFAKYGFDGLRVDELAKQAGVNKATIYYYYKDKSLLFQKTVEVLVLSVQHEVSLRVSACSCPKEKLEAYIDAIIFIISTQRDLAKIMMQELAFNAKNVSQEIKMQFFVVLKHLGALLKEGEKAGLFKEIDPAIVHTATIGSLNYYFIFKESIQEEVPFDLAPEGEKKIKEMVLSFVLK